MNQSFYAYCALRKCYGNDYSQSSCVIWSHLWEERWKSSVIHNCRRRIIMRECFCQINDIEQQKCKIPYRRKKEKVNNKMQIKFTLFNDIYWQWMYNSFARLKEQSTSNHKMSWRMSLLSLNSKPLKDPNIMLICLVFSFLIDNRSSIY